MIEERAHVVAIEQDRVCIETAAHGGCEGCAVSRGCGASLWSKVFGMRAARLWVENRAGANLNDEVIVGLSEAALLRGSLAMYAVPLLALIVGAAVGQWLSTRLGIDNPDILSALFGFAVAGMALVWVRGYAARVGCDPKFQPVVLRIERHATRPPNTQRGTTPPNPNLV